MVTTWIGYCLLTAGLLGLAAFAGERALGHYRRPVRGMWVAAILGSVALPVLAFLAPGLFREASQSSPLLWAGMPGAAPTPMVPGLVAAPSATAAGGGLDPAAVSALLGWVWGLSILFIGLHLVRMYRRLHAEMRQWTPVEILGSPVLLSSDRGPAVIGVRRAVIVMPRWISELEEDLLRLVFLHEREHQKAGDHRLFALGISALVLMPWNFLLWWQVARLRLAIEFDCDRRVLARGVAPRDYAEALITVGSRVSAPLLAAAAFAERKPAVERRLRRMTEPLARLRAPRMLGASSVAALAIILVLGAPPPPPPITPSPAQTADGVPESAAFWLPPPAAGRSASDRPSFLPYDRPPILTNRDDVVEAIAAAYPDRLKEAGVGGRVEIWLYINEEGQVERHLTKTSSGHVLLDAAAEEVAPTMRFKPAVNRDQPTAVWVSQHITFTTPKRVPLTDKTDGDPLIVIDGVIQSRSTRLSDLPALDIDHIEVVKREAAARLYGDRAKNGVVEITTKKSGGR